MRRHFLRVLVLVPLVLDGDHAVIQILEVEVDEVEGLHFEEAHRV